VASVRMSCVRCDYADVMKICILDIRYTEHAQSVLEDSIC
jgi:hypothetical protein